MKYTFSDLVIYVKNFLTTGQERSITAKKNIIGSLIIKGLSIVISLVIVPLTLNYLNPSNYGIWLVLSSMVMWIAFFDIGFTQGLRNKFAIAKAKGDIQLARSYISTAYYYISIIFIIVWIVLFVVRKFVHWHSLLNIPIENENEISSLAVIILTYLCLQFVLRIINTVLIADQNPAKASLLDLLGQAISLVIIFLLTKFTKGSLIYLGLAVGISQIIVLLFGSVILFKNQYKAYRPSFKYVKKEYAKDLLNLGIKFFVPQIAAIVQYQSASFLIAHYFNTEQVTSYNIAYKYFFTLQMVFMILLTPLWSGVTDAYNTGDVKWIKNVVGKYLLILIPFVLGGGLMLVLSNQVYDLWLGKNVVHIGFSISFLCYIYLSTYMFSSIFVSVINGVGALTIQFISSIVTSTGFIALSLVLIKSFHFGIEAILISIIISNVYGYILAPIQYYKIFYIGSKSKIWYH